MGIGLDAGTLLIGILVFLARIADVAMGTIRTICIVQARTRAAFVLGFVEISLWLAVITTVLSKVMGKPVLGIFYALGFATGNVVGILLERRLAAGPIVLRTVACRHGQDMVERIGAAGYNVLTFEGKGPSGAVKELHVFCRRRDLRDVVAMVKELEPEAFYIMEQAGRVSKITRPTMQRATGWRAIVKRK